MMRPVRFSLALVAVALVVVACTDRPSPTEPDLRLFSSQANAQLGSCTTFDALSLLVDDVFGAGSPDANSAQSKLRTVDRAVKKGDVAAAQDAARKLIRFVLEKANTLPGRDKVPQLIGALECWVGLRDDTFLVYPTDQPQTLIADGGATGILLESQPVSEPTLITLVVLPDTTAGILDTKLDQYPGFVEITQTSGVENSLIKPVVVGVCASAGIAPSVLQRLRLGHQASTGFELTPPADASFLDCSSVSGVASAEGRASRWMRSVANFVLPKPAYAAVAKYVLESGGVGGTVTEFSPFGPVDPELSFSGGVGGTVTEFIRVPAPSDATRPTREPVRSKTATAARAARTKTAAPTGTATTRVAPANLVDCSQATVGTALALACRPRVTITTANGTILQNVPVSFAIGLGGGTTAIDDPTTRACGPFGASASTTTNVNGKAGACWTLGAEAGTNTLIATASAGGDAPPGVTFTPASAEFTVTALKATATLALSNLSQTYTGSPLAVTVTTEPAGLAGVSVTYDGSPTAPTDAGSYAVVAMLDHPSYEGTTSGSLVIGPAAQSALVLSGPASATYGDPAVQLDVSGGSGTGDVSFDAGASTACAVSGGGLLTMTSGSGSCAVTATKAADANHTAITSNSLDVTAAKAAATLSLSGLAAVYDGSSKSATVTTDPAGLTEVSVTYDGSATAPTDAGSYAVVASLSNPDYQASDAAGTLVIARADQPAFTLAAPESATYGAGPVATSVSGGAGSGAVSYTSLSPATCSVDAGGIVTILSGAGSCLISAEKAGDANFNAITAPTAGIALNRAGQTISFGPLAATSYGDAPFSVSATATSGLPVSFSAVAGSNCSVSGSTVTLTGAGSCTVEASQAGDASYFLAATPVAQSFAIAKRAATATAGSGTMTLGSAIPSLPCTVDGLLAADAGSVTCATVVPSFSTAGTYETTPAVSPSDPANYLVTPINGALTVSPLYVQVGCFAEPLDSKELPPKTSGMTKGSTVQVKCHLEDANGSVVTNATGSIKVEDRGVNGTSAATLVFSAANVFVLTNGDYTYKLSTTSSGFVKGRFYVVTATWSDGSTTQGWFYLNK